MRPGRLSVDDLPRSLISVGIFDHGKALFHVENFFDVLVAKPKHHRLILHRYGVLYLFKARLGKHAVHSLVAVDHLGDPKIYRNATEAIRIQTRQPFFLTHQLRGVIFHLDWLVRLAISHDHRVSSAVYYSI